MKLSKIKALFATTLLGIGMVASTALAADITPTAEEGVFPITPSYTYTVQGDVSEIAVDVTYAAPVDDGATFGFNDWCGNAIKVTDADGTVTYYGFGGAQVTWPASIEADKDEVVPAAGSDGFFTLSAEGTGSFSVPVAGAGSTIDVYDLCWTTYKDAAHYTINFSGDAEAPADTEAPTDDTEAPADDTEAPADDSSEETTEAPADTTTPATGDATAMVVVLMAAAAAAIVVMKKREA